MEKQLPIVAIDIEQGKQFKWKMGKVEKEELVIPNLTIEQLMALRGGKLIKSKQPKYSPKQMITIKKLANYAILNPEQWYQITQFFALAKTIDFHAETVKVLESNGKRYSYPESMIPLLTEANLMNALRILLLQY